MILYALAIAAAHASSLDLSLGAASGGSFARVDVFDAHETAAFIPSWSPLASAQVVIGHGPVRPSIGVTTAPTFLYSMGYDAFTAPLVVADAGIALGGEDTHVTLGAHAGLWSFGADARLVTAPWSLGKGWRTGVEVRATWLARQAVLGGVNWVARR